ELRHEEPDERGLTRARWSKDERVPDVAHVEVQSKRCGAGRRGVEQRRTTLRVGGARIPHESRPDTRERQKVGEVQGVEHRPPDVLVPMPGERAEPGLEGVRLLEAGTEAVVL